MAGLNIPTYKPPTRPPARPPQTGSYQQTVNGQTYIPSPEENAEAARKAAVTRSSQQAAWAETDYLDAARQRDTDAQRTNQLDADRQSLIRNMFGEINTPGSSTPGTATATPPTGSTAPAGATDADRAYYTRAKESTGNAMQAAMRGLDEDMNRRGISGSGIQAQGLTELYEGGLGELAEADRDLAEGGAERAYQSNEAALSRGWQSGENAKDRAANLATSRLQSILNMYGMIGRY